MIQTIGIRREDKNIWEKRVPLVPKDLADLSGQGALSFVAQPSPIRIFPDAELQKAGVRIQEDLSACDLVMGVKEMPLSFFRPDGRYLFFSHTIKGQKHNMPMLRRLMELKCTLIDYEKIVDANGRRLVFFGRYAGLAGMIDTLWALGRRLAWEGIPTPLADIHLAHAYPNLDAAREAVREIGRRIAREGLPEALCPLVIGFTGYGNVSRGAQEIFDLLPHREVTPEELPAAVSSHCEPGKLLKVVFKEHHTVRPREAGKAFDLPEYFAHPERFENAFAPFLPWLSVLVNCIFWSKSAPRLLTKAEAAQIWAPGQQPRLKVIGDISCDILGGIEFTVRETQPDEPVYVYEPHRDDIIFGVEGVGPVVMAVDNLPCELSAEASMEFSRALKPLIGALSQVKPRNPFADCGLPDELRRAVILWQGDFTPDFQFMREFLS